CLGLGLAALPATIIASMMQGSDGISGLRDLAFIAYGTGAVLIVPVAHLGIVLLRGLAQPNDQA
ncbi:hypothetical protein BZU93_28260, partial [Salmonella enterica subsp. enterica]|nr:hypothetical protein [Salmonella enterica subsp. enterica serovar Enteritidis]